MSDEDFDKVAQFNGEISALNKRIAEMQRGKGVMPNASPAQRFVTNVLMKALNRIKGIKVHRATQADVERVMAQTEDGKVEMQRNSANTSFNDFLQQYISGKTNTHQIWHANIDGVLQYLTNGKELSVRQAVLNKAAKKHNIDLNSLGDLIDKQSDPVVIFKSAREDVNGKVVLIEAKDNDGHPIVIAINMDGKQGNMDVNVVTSIYGRENIEDLIRWGEKDLVEGGNVEKFEALINSFPEYNSQGNLKSALQEIAAKLQQKTETAKSEDKIELLKTSDGTVYGWSIGNEIWLTDEGMNPETPIHEYTHLFAKQMQQADAKAWKQVVSLCKKAKELWDAVKNDPNYSHLTTDDEIASEVLSRYSGKRGSQQAVGTAEQMVKDGKSFESDASAKVLIGRINKALEAFWGWVTDKLGIGHKYKSLDEIADKSLHDLLSGSEIEIADFTEEQEIIDKQEK